MKFAFFSIASEMKSHFHGSLKGNFSVILLNASVAILIGSKPKQYAWIPDRKINNNLLSSSSGNGIGPFLSAVKRPSHGTGTGGSGSSFFLMLY